MTHNQNEKSPVWQQMAMRCHANHCCVESSTTLLKPPVMVWWKLWGYKIIDHLCGTLRCDRDGLFIFRPKEVQSNDSSGPTSTSNSKWVIKGAVVKFVRICSSPVSEVILISCVMQTKMCLIAHQRVVLASFSPHPVKLTKKLQAYLSVPINQSMHSLQSVEKILVTMQDAPYTLVRYAYRLSKHTCRLSWTETDGCQHLGNVLGCVNTGRPIR